MAATSDGGGYYLVASDGGVFSYGDAVFYGSTGSIHLNQPMVGMAVVPGGGGYWLVASDGGIFSYGDATFYGSTGSIHLNQPVVGMAATPSGNGYWLVAADGGIFSYGDASFHGSTGSLVLNKPIVGMITGPAGAGYFLVASDGGIFSFGTAPFYGSLGGPAPQAPDRGGGGDADRQRLLVHGLRGTGVELRIRQLLRVRSLTPFQADRGHGRGSRHHRRLRRLDLPLGVLRLRHQHVPVQQPAGGRPSDRHRAGRRELVGEHQPVPRARSWRGPATGSTSTPT